MMRGSMLGQRSLKFVLLLVCVGCSRHPTSCLSRPAPPSASARASAEVAKILLTELPEEDGGEAGGEAFIEMVRREAWDEAAAAIADLPEEKRKKPSIRLVRGRVAMSRGDYGAALEAFSGLEKDLTSIADDLERWRAECQ